jgi:hypothetical protein
MAGALVAAALAAGIAIALRSPTGARDVDSAPWSNLPTLRGADAFVTLVAIDKRADVAEFRVRCGVFTKYANQDGEVPAGKLAAARVQPGLYRVPLRGGTFDRATFMQTPSGPVPTNPNYLTLTTWERWTHSGWKASLRSGSTGPFLSDGATTDICHGVLG